MTTSTDKKSVLFLCTGNSARSQMAEALLRDKASDQFEVFSAGTAPEGIDERTLQALAQVNIAVKGLHSKNVSGFSEKHFDYVITLCDKANQECREFSGAKNQLAWDFSDPKSQSGLTPFVSTINELNRRLAMFINLVADQPKLAEVENNTDTLTIDPIDFYKCLTDDIRLKTLMLTHYHGELCVCELMAALTQDSQPKVSRNLAVLKKAQIIIGRKHGQWVFYRINPALPEWVKNVIAQTTENNIALITEAVEHLATMNNRPDKVSFCR